MFAPAHSNRWLRDTERHFNTLHALVPFSQPIMHTYANKWIQLSDDSNKLWKKPSTAQWLQQHLSNKICDPLPLNLSCQGCHNYIYHLLASTIYLHTSSQPANTTRFIVEKTYYLRCKTEHQSRHWDVQVALQICTCICPAQAAQRHKRVSHECTAQVHTVLTML